MSLPAPIGSQVIAAPADDDVVARAADDGVISVAAIKREVDLAGMERGSIDGVVASEPVNDERVVAGVGAIDRHLRRQSIDDNRRAAGDDADAVIVPAVPLTITVSA